MERRAFLKTSALASLALTADPGELFAQKKRTPPKPKPAPPPVASTTPPVLQNISDTGVTVFWTASSAATGWVEYGETPELGQIARGGLDGLLPYDDRVLRVRLSGLKPGTTYHYRVHTAAFDFTHPYSVGRGAGQPGEVHAFKTLDAAASEARFIVWNDTHQNKETLAQLVKQLSLHPADFLVWNGDIFNFIGSDDALITETLHPAGLGYASTRPVMFVRGNHDVRGNHARAIRRAIDAPDGKFYYQFRHGPVAFLVMDTGEDKPDDHSEYGGLTDFAGYRTEQAPWLKSIVSRPEFERAAFRVLFTHIPLRGRGESKDAREKWEALLRAGRIDLAISGHTHHPAHHDPTPEQPWPLLIGGGPAPQQAAFIQGHATSQHVDYRQCRLDGSVVGEWRIQRKT